MKVALVAWDLGDAIAGELAKLSAEVVGFTRWFPGHEVREHREHWTLLRCAHRIGGTARDEAQAFGEAVVEIASRSGIGFDFDVIHCLDRLARPAAAELAGRAATSVLLASLGAADEGTPGDDGFGRRPDVWVCDHPWLAEGLREHSPAKVPLRVVLSAGALASLLAPEPSPDRAGTQPSPTLVVALSRKSRVSSSVLITALKRVRETIGGLSVSVLGLGPQAELLRRRLGKQGLLAVESAGSAVRSLAGWNASIAHASVVGVGARVLSDNPVARLAWMAGRPVVRLLTDDSERLAYAIRAGILDPAQRDRAVEAARVLGRREVEPSGVAAAWMKVYVDALSRKLGPSLLQRRGTGPPRASTQLGFPELRSRLTLVPLSAREVLASWCLRPEDWKAALEWLGADSVRAVLTVRIFDVTDLTFNGMNAHSVSDFDLGYGEQHRTIGLRFDGRSLAACLGLRTQWGYFHPIVHARLCHLPREGLAPSLPARRLRVMPRRDTP
jgi:hypothetical protein